MDNLPGCVVTSHTRIALRVLGMSRDWKKTGAGFTARLYHNWPGIEDVGADDPEEVPAALTAPGAERISWGGVRPFSRPWGASEHGDDSERLVEAQEQAGNREAHRRVCALNHTTAHRVGLRLHGAESAR